MQTSPVISRMVNARQWQRVTKLIASQAEKPGCQVVFGGKSDEADLYIQPTIVTGMSVTTKNDPLMGEELFGPVLPIVAYDTLDEGTTEL